MSAPQQHHAPIVNIIAGQVSRDGDQVKMGKVIMLERPKSDGPAYSQHQHRLREIEAVIRSRHGNQLPETDDADIYLEVVAHAYQAEMLARGDDLETRLRGWCSVFAPWANIRAGEVIRPILEKVRHSKQDLNTQEVAALLRVSWAEREALGLRRIGAFDKSRDEQKALAADRKRKLDRERVCSKRREKGVVPRSEYLSKAKTQTKPWEADGVSKRTYYRRLAQAKLGGTSPSRIEVITKCDTPVPKLHSGSVSEALNSISIPLSHHPRNFDTSPHSELSNGNDNPASCADVFEPVPTVSQYPRGLMADAGFDFPSIKEAVEQVELNCWSREQATQAALSCAGGVRS